jgi:four helix bundle protein
MRNAECEMETQQDGKHSRDIHERALVYGVRAVRLFRHLKGARDEAAMIVGRQFLRSATSVGANLAEADAAETRADFVHKCAVAQKEARECQYWLRLMARAEFIADGRLAELAQETDELVRVIATIGRNARRRRD